MIRTLRLPLVLLFLASCASYSDRVQTRTETLPSIRLASLQGQTVAVDVRQRVNRKTVYAKFMREDLEQSFEKAGVHVGAAAPVQLNVTIDYLSTDYRTGRWESCGQATAQVIRDGQVIAKPVSKYCTSETVNPWQAASTNVGLNPAEARSRTYYGLVSDLLVKLEKSL
ncbi:MAG TPA: hypothetical protein VKB93_20720 [Thermoanaerobaculia bacterium]|nr:hypothetical protein [Thermoanaerobaculia bacterium]